MRQARLLALVLAAVASVSALVFLTTTPAPAAPAQQRPAAFPNLSRAVVIALDRETGRAVADGVRTFLGIRDAEVFDAVNGTQAMEYVELPLYTRALMLSGRHDHMQLSNAGMLGCLLSHMEVWRGVRPGETVAVFEEDALFDATSAERWRGLAEDLDGVPWDLLILESGQFIATGHWRHVGTYAATCATGPASGPASGSASASGPSSGRGPASGRASGPASSGPTSAGPGGNTSRCTWFGTRGYLVSGRGAATLLGHALPVSVQVDALMGLVAAFQPGFRMYWTRADVAHQNPFHVSRVWDGCLKCFMPSSPAYSVLALAVWALGLVAVGAAGAARCCACGKALGLL